MPRSTVPDILNKYIERLFKDIFDAKISEAYQDVITRYKALREDTDLAFQEKVMESLLDIKKDKAEIVELLFPALQDIATRLEDLADATKAVLTELQVREKFRSYRKNLKPTNTHQRQLDATTQPLRRGIAAAHRCQWLFTHKHYQSWERPAPKPCAKKKDDPATDPTGETPAQSPTNLLYLKGRAGFGKSVILASVIERLQKGQMENTYNPSQHTTDKNQAEKYPVLFFFFKRGDDSTQLTSRAFSNLVTQLFHEEHAKTKEDMEKFISAIDSVSAASKKDGRVMGRADTESSEEAPPITSNQDILKLESLASAIERTVYIVIDGIDECIDYEAEGLVSELIKLGRSKKANLKIIISSREDMNLEAQFAKDGDYEGQEQLKSAASQASDSDSESEVQVPVLHVAYDDTVIFTVTKEANSEDMKTYLNYSLRELMRRRQPGASKKKSDRHWQNESNPRQRKLDAIIRKIAELIQKRSDGMFTYSAMVITNIGQPSPLSLRERLENLPDGMNALYSRQLEALTGAERKLVTLALKRIIWSPTDMGTVEIAEEFKQMYIREHEARKDDGIDDYDSDGVDGSVSGDDDLEENPTADRDQAVGQLPTRPPLHRKDTSPGENPIDKAMRNPEIADTIFHLDTAAAGRDIFKLANDKQTIDLIHKSVRDWYETESAKAADRDCRIESVASLFSRDSDSGELKLTLPIPWIVLKGQSEATELQSEKDAQLDILIYIMQVLTHPRFQATYLPYYEPPKKPEEVEKPTESKAEDGAAPGTDGSPTGKNEQSSDDSAQEFRNSDSASEDQKSENMSTEDSKPSQTTDFDESGVAKEGDTEQTFHKGRWRCEIHQWIHHMRRVGELWPRSERGRNNKKWMELEGLLRKFSEPKNFRRWFIQYVQFEENESLERACEKTVGMDLIHVTAYFGLEALMEFLINEAATNVMKVSRHGEIALHYKQMFYLPDMIKLMLEHKADVNLKTPDGETPLAVCLQAKEFSYHPVSHDSEPVKKLIQSLKHLISYGADVNVALPSGERSLQALIAIGDESLFNLVMERKSPGPEVDVTLADGNQRTALHSVWTYISLAPSAQVSIARKLLEAGANPNAQDCDSKAPLLEAVLSGNKEGVELLLEDRYGVDINDEDVDGLTALITLAGPEYRRRKITDAQALELINILIGHGADLKLRAKSGWTALMSSILNERWDIANALITAHSKEQENDHSYLMQTDINDETVLHAAASNRFAGIDIAKFVLKNLTAEETSNLIEQKEPSKGLTALHKAVCSQNFDFAAYLLECGAKSSVDSEGESAADAFFKYWMDSKNTDYSYYSSFDPMSEIWTRLYTTMLPNDSNNVYLHYAITVGSKELIEKLAQAGIDPFKKDSANWDAFDWAYAYNRQEMMQECFPNIEVDYQNRNVDQKDTFNPITGWDVKRSHNAFKFPEIDTICEVSEDDDIDYGYNKSAFGSCSCGQCVKTRMSGFVAVANSPIPPYAEQFYYEITITSANKAEGSTLAVGLVGEGAPSYQMPGFDYKDYATYGLQSDQGATVLGSFEDGVEDNITYGAGDTVGCGYSKPNQTVFWTLNGRRLGYQHERKDVCYRRLYPAIGAKGWFSASANFGNDPNKPFMWKGFWGAAKDS
ncbi:hypothetical protein TWF281_001766 [Arthrobotrys megalospora]